MDTHPALLDFVTSPEVVWTAAPAFGYVPAAAGDAPGGRAADGVAHRLRSAGRRAVARQPALPPGLPQLSDRLRDRRGARHRPRRRAAALPRQGRVAAGRRRDRLRAPRGALPAHRRGRVRARRPGGGAHVRCEGGNRALPRVERVHALRQPQARPSRATSSSTRSPRRVRNDFMELWRPRRILPVAAR